MNKSYVVMLAALACGAWAQPTTATPAAPVKVTTPTRSAASYVTVGNYYYNAGRYEEAYVAFKAATETDSRHPGALLGLGRSQVRLRMFKPALATLQRLISLDKANLSGYIALAQAYQQEYIASRDRASLPNNLSEAAKMLTEAEQVVRAAGGKNLNVNLSKIWNERGSIYRLQGDVSKAIDAFGQASALNPDEGLILYNLGDMYAASGDYAAALRSLQQAVIADPRDPYNRAYYAKLLALTGNLTAAVPEAAQAAKLAPNNAYANGQFGVVSYLAQDYSTARTQLEKAIQQDALNYPEFYYYLGRLALDTAELQKAREQFTAAASLGSTNPEWLYYLALSYERGSAQTPANPAKARENYQRVLKLSPNYEAAKEGLARLP